MHISASIGPSVNSKDLLSSDTRLISTVFNRTCVTGNCGYRKRWLTRDRQLSSIVEDAANDDTTRHRIETPESRYAFNGLCCMLAKCHRAERARAQWCMMDTREKLIVLECCFENTENFFRSQSTDILLPKCIMFYVSYATINS